MIITKEDLVELFIFNAVWNNKALNSLYKSKNDDSNINHLKIISNKKFMFYFHLFDRLKRSFNDISKNYSELVVCKDAPTLTDILETLQNFFTTVLKEFDVETFRELKKSFPNYQPIPYSENALEKEIERISIKDDDLIPFIKRENQSKPTSTTLELFLPAEYLRCFELLFNFREFSGVLADKNIDRNKQAIAQYISEQRQLMDQLQQNDFHNELTKINKSIYDLFQQYEQSERSKFPLTLIAQADIIGSNYNLRRKTSSYKFNNLISFKNFQSNLSTFMKIRNLSISQLNKHTGIDRKTIGKYLHSEKPIEIQRKHLQKIAITLGVTFDFLVSKSTSPIESFNKKGQAIILVAMKVLPYQIYLDIYEDGRDISKETLKLLITKDQYLTDNDF